MAIIETGSAAVGTANVDTDNNLQVVAPGFTADGTERGGGSLNAEAMFSEVDDGTLTGVREMLSPEVDKDFRLRVAHDNVVDQELFNYTAQNTGKHTFTFTTLAATIAASGITTNSSSVTTTTTGLTFGTFAMFPVGGTQNIVCETSVSFTAQPVANVIIDFGLFQRGATTAFAPTDGMYFRNTSSGMFGVINNNGSETTVALTINQGADPFLYTNNAVNRYLIQTSNVSTTFWVNNYKVGEILNPTGTNFACKSQALPWSFRHAIVGGAAGGVLQAIFTDYRVHIRGLQYADSLGTIGNRVFGSYQGLSGGTMGQLIAGTVTSGTLVKPTAAVPLNASLAANLPNSLGGRAYETLTGGLAANVDGILASFTVPAGTALVQGRRLKVTGIQLRSHISTVIVGNAITNEYYIAFGHTADSMATTESASMGSATTKAPRRIMLPDFTQIITASQAVNTIVSQGAGYIRFDNPIYVNPSERIALIINKTGTVPTSGVVSHIYQFDYSWE